MTDKLRDAAQQALDDDLLTGQALHLIGALMSRGFLPNTLSSAERTTLWDVVKRHLRCVNKEGARAALAQQDAQAVPPGYKLVPVKVTEEMEKAWWTNFGDVHALWAAMLNTAPTPPAQEKQS